MTTKKIVAMLDNIEQQLDLILIAVGSAEVREGYNRSFKDGAISRLRTAQSQVSLAITELDRLR